MTISVLNHHSGAFPPLPPTANKSTAVWLECLDLPDDARIPDLDVLRQHECLAQDDRQSRITLERQENLFTRCPSRTAPVRHDAEILIIWFHEDIPTAEVDFVGAELAADNQELVCKRKMLGSGETRHEAFQGG